MHGGGWDLSFSQVELHSLMLSVMFCCVDGVVGVFGALFCV